jgi:polysaccharide biosynthesis transport protein
LMVAGAGKVRREELRRSLRLLDTAGARLIGVVLNLLPPGLGVATGYYSYAESSRRSGRGAHAIPAQGRAEAVPEGVVPAVAEGGEAHTVRIRPVREASRRAR